MMEANSVEVQFYDGTNWRPFTRGSETRCLPGGRPRLSWPTNPGRLRGHWGGRRHPDEPFEGIVRLLCDALHVLDAKLVGPACQEFIELRLGGPHDLLLQHLYQPVD